MKRPIPVIRGDAEFEDLWVETRFEYVKDPLAPDHLKILWLGQPLIKWHAFLIEKQVG